MNPIDDLLEARRPSIEAALRQVLPGPHPEEPRLVEAIGYSLLSGGKRIRPIVAILSCELSGGTEEDVMPAACALEMIHAFSLIHDDLPALDDDDLRRGRPSSHARYGEAMAILAGDALVSLAFRTIAERTLDPGRATRLVAEVSDATFEMIRGQVADIEGEDRAPTEDRVRMIHRHKTAALFRASARVGAIAAGAPAETLDRLGRYGEALGLSFQIADDLLDEESTSEALGKRAGKDRDRGKITYPAVFGIENSRRQAGEIVDEAVEAIESIPGSAPLADLARYVVDRVR